jgi:hypothetical protein
MSRQEHQVCHSESKADTRSANERCVADTEYSTSIPDYVVLDESLAAHDYPPEINSVTEALRMRFFDL